MDNPMDKLKYVPKVGDIFLNLHGDHDEVYKVEKTHLYLKSSKSVGRAIPQFRSDLISGKIFLIRKDK